MRRESHRVIRVGVREGRGNAEEERERGNESGMCGAVSHSLE